MRSSFDSIANAYSAAKNDNLCENKLSYSKHAQNMEDHRALLTKPVIFCFKPRATEVVKIEYLNPFEILSSNSFKIS